VNRRTIVRWVARGDFPQPVIFHRRLYFERRVIEMWKASMARRKAWQDMTEKCRATLESGNAMVSEKPVHENDRDGLFDTTFCNYPNQFNIK
jgi:hypothetical protein